MIYFEIFKANLNSQVQYLVFIDYLIRRNLRADNFSCIFAHDLSLREVARKQEPFFSILRTKISLG